MRSRVSLPSTTIAPRRLQIALGVTVALAFGAATQVTSAATAGGLRAPFARPLLGFAPADGTQGPHGVARTVRVGANPVGIAADTSTHTIYVANTGDNTVSVIDARRCTATEPTGCRQSPPAIPVGGAPLAVAVDGATRTVYVSNLADGTVSMIDAAACDATHAAGCGQMPPTGAVGGSPGLLAIDEVTNTIYVPNFDDGTVSLIDGATCNATDSTGCANTATVAVGAGPQAVAIDQRTHTAYIANYQDGTVSLIDTATCNATHLTGCGRTPSTVDVGPNPDALVVDRPSHTIYVDVGLHDRLGSLVMIDGSACNASVTTGCGQSPPTTPIGSSSIWIAENQATRTVYALNQEDSNVSVIDAATCNATRRRGCRKTPRAMASGFNAGGVDVDPSTGTVYATSQNNGTVSVLSGATCDATHSSGCTPYAPTTAAGANPQPIAVDRATHTVYAGNSTEGTVSVIDALACNAAHPSGCDRAWPTIQVAGDPFYGLALDRRDHTLYVSNRNDNSISLVDTATCNAHASAGCAATPPAIPAGNSPAGLALDRRTGTLYVADTADNTLSLVDAATCNARDTSGCERPLPTVRAGNQPLPIALDRSTETLYAGDLGDSTVSVIDAAVCNARTTSGCNQTPAHIKVDDAPFGLAVDQRTDTLYVANTGTEIFQTGYANVTSGVSMINTATCNATRADGCAQTPASVPVGGLPTDVAVDPATHAVYVTSIVDSSLSMIDGAVCNAHLHQDCHARSLPIRTGGWPAEIGLDPADGTIYVADNVDAAISLFSMPRQ